MKENPTYYDLGDHSETIQMDFDPAVVTFQELLDIFWKSHDPGRRVQSAQYKTAVFYHSDEQKRIAVESLDRLAGATGVEIQTEIRPYSNFTIAEDYHQKYYLRRQQELVKEYLAIYPDVSDFIDSTAVARVNGYVAGFGTPARLRAELKGLGLTPAAGELISRIVSSRKS
jgi:peptide-methionine (S)-S-oxide reductase